MIAEQVRQRIEEAFSDVVYPGDDQLAYSQDAWECPELIASFKGRHWREVPGDIIKAHYDNLPLFSPAGYQFYLPAFLLAAFDDLDVRDFLLSELKSDADYDREKFDGLTAAQKLAVRAFLELMRDLAADELTRRYWSEPLEKYWGRDWT